MSKRDEINNSLPLELIPEFNRPVRAIVKHFAHFKYIQTVDLISVDEDDQLWRTVDDNSELSYDYNVIYWEYIK